MKSATCLLLSFFILTLATKSSIANQELAGLPAPIPVYDIRGNSLRAGTEYYIVSSIRGAGGGGLTVGKSPRNKTGCPLDIIQLPFDLWRGSPATFTPVDYAYGTTIRESTDLTIKFSPGFVPPCVRSTEWRVLKSSDSNKEWPVRVGGLLGNPSSNTIANKFQIQTAGYGGYFYKLAFCPTEIGHGDVSCKDLGLYFEHDGTRRLVSNGNHTFGVVFQEAVPNSINLINAE